MRGGGEGEETFGKQLKIILSKLEAVVCESYGLLFAWSPLRHYLRELLVKKWYNAYILLD